MLTKIVFKVDSEEGDRRTLLSNEIKINHQESIKKRDLSKEKEDMKFEIPQSFKCKENKA